MSIKAEITRWNPFNELEELQNRAKTFFIRSNGGSSLLGTAGAEADWIPAVDVTEDEKEFMITADLPEVSKEDVKVSLDEDLLTIQGERHHEKEESKTTFHRRERGFGKYTRSFQLPKDIDAGKIDARFEAGVLKIHLPKRPARSEAAQEIKVS